MALGAEPFQLVFVSEERHGENLLDNIQITLVVVLIGDIGIRIDDVFDVCIRQTSSR